MEPIVYDTDVMAEFFSHAASVLEHALRCEDPAAAIYGKAGSIINAEVTAGRLTVRSDAMGLAATLLRSIADEAARLAVG